MNFFCSHFLNIDDEPTAGRERERFVQMVKNNHFETREESKGEDYDRYMSKTVKRMNNMQSN